MASFQGLAPTGAKFGYNLAKDPDLASVFPPLPLDSSFFEVYGSQWGTSREPDEAIKVDANGIWWMIDDYGWAPWSIDYWEGDPGAPAQSGDAAERPAPVDLQEMHGWYDDPTNTYTLSIFMWFTKLASKTNDGIVASLQPCPDSPIEVFDCNCEEEASTGHLRLGLNLSLGESEDLTDGGVVFKGVTGLQFDRGWVTEGVKSLSPLIAMTSDNESDDGYHQGKVSIDFLDPNTSNKELPVALVALDNAREETQDDIMFLSFPAAKDSRIRGKIEVPVSGFSSEVTYELVLRFWILATSPGTLPDLEFSHRRVPVPSGVGSLPTSDETAVALSLGSAVVGANDYIEVETDPFTIVGGDSVFFTLARDAANGDGFAGKLGVLRQKGIVQPQS